MSSQRRRFVLFALLGLSAAGVAYDRLRPAGAGVSAAVVRKPAAAAPTERAQPATQVAALRARTDFTSSSSDNAFEATRPLAPVVVAAPPAAPVQPPAPSAPPLPFTVIGKKLEGGVWEVYLAKGDASFIAKPGTVIADEYRVEAIAATTMTLIYLPLNEKQTLQTGASLQ